MMNRLIILLLCSLPLWARAYDAIYEKAPINYPTAPVNDPVAKLGARLASGELKLAYDDKFGYLPALLKALDIPVSSQTLVFSKTSFQRDLINPRSPRALYFNDEVYVGYCQGGEVLEISSTDPTQGAIFYSLRQKPSKANFVRQNDACLQCHASSMTNDLPGHIVRSVYPSPDGNPILSAGTFRTNHTSPFKQRWGGWYVTGTSGDQQHMGNVIAADQDSVDKTDFTAGTNVTDLSAKIDTAPYLSPHSDIVALMVMEHQTFVHNMITRASFLGRVTLHDAVEMNKALKRPLDFRSDSTTSRLKNAAEPLLKAMLFCEESPLTGEVKGTTSFAADFSKPGPRDSAGRSLRDLDLKTRLFKHPLSYLIYSPSFDSLPPEVKDPFYQKLHEVLTGKDQSKDYAHLSPADRKAILEILQATRKGLPDFFQAAK